MERAVVQLSPDPEGALVESAIRAIEERMRRDRMRVGDLIPTEARLAANLGVSRTVVGKWLRALATLGITDLGNGRRAGRRYRKGCGRAGFNWLKHRHRRRLVERWSSAC